MKGNNNWKRLVNCDNLMLLCLNYSLGMLINTQKKTIYEKERTGSFW